MTYNIFNVYCMMYTWSYNISYINTFFMSLSIIKSIKSTANFINKIENEIHLYN